MRVAKHEPSMAVYMLFCLTLKSGIWCAVVCPKKMNVLRYNWPSNFKFLLDILINPAKARLNNISRLHKALQFWIKDALKKEEFREK